MEDSVYDLKQEVKLLRDLLDGNYPSNVHWLMTKLDRQRRALDSLQKKGKNHTRAERIENGIIETCQKDSQTQLVS